MGISNIFKMAQVGVLATAMLVPAANAAIVFQDTFDGDLTTLGDRRDDGVYGIATHTWAKSRYINSRISETNVEVGNGVLRVETDFKPYGGAVTTQPKTEFDFFANEITITLEGITIESIGNGRFAAQGLKLGVASILSFGYNNWSSYSNFGVGFYGSGRFIFSGYNASIRKPEPVALQSIPTPFLNFDVSQITALKLTLNDTHYRLAFEFGNSLNSLSFAGLHYLNKDQWFVSNTMRRLVFDKNNAEADLAAAQASGDPVAIADAQAAYDAAVLAYDEKWAGEEAGAGKSFIFIGAVSEDGEGAAVTVDTITVETTNILDVLKTP